MVIFIGILLFVGLLYWDVKSDYIKWKQNKPVNHFEEWVIRILLMTPSTIMLSTQDFTVLKFFLTALMQGAWWWEFFDGFYNKLRGYSWRFNGSVDEDDSFLDTLLYKLNDTQETILKWGLIILFTSLYIIS